MSKISVVISAYNEEAKIAECLRSVSFADEIIVVDGKSSDRTVEIAKEHKAKVFPRENNLMLNVNKNFGFTKAESEWILNLDADERVTRELRDEITEVLQNASEDIAAYSMPRKNIIFGKWIKHTGWYPDRQIRLFRQKKGQFPEKHVHEQLIVEGEIAELTAPLEHESYKTVSEFLLKFFTIYAPNEAMVQLASQDYKFQPSDFVKKPAQEFLNRFYHHKGYADGLHGLALSLLMSFYHFVVVCLIWERKGFIETTDSSKVFHESFQDVKKDIAYWESTVKIDNSKGKVERILNRVRRKISS